MRRRRRLPTAEQSDPAALGWMVVSPPPADKIMRRDDGSSQRFPQRRWSLSNYRQFAGTTNVSRGLDAPTPLPRALRDDLDAVAFTPLGKTQPMSWGQAFDANYTDGIVVLHKGRIVYERYDGVFTPQGQHTAMSVTKSFFGTIGAMLVAEGRLLGGQRLSMEDYVMRTGHEAGGAVGRRGLELPTLGGDPRELRGLARDTRIADRRQSGRSSSG